MVVTGVTRPAIETVMPRRRVAEGGSFGVKAEHSAHTDEMVATTAIAMTSLLTLQEVDPEERNEGDAKRHGAAMVDELTEVQRALLRGDRPDLDRLEALVARAVPTQDASLAGLLRAMRLRANIELTRHGRAASM